MGSQTLTVGRNFYSIIGALLELLCDLEAPLVLVLRRNLKKINLTSNILEIQNMFLFLNSSLIREVMIVNI